MCTCVCACPSVHAEIRGQNAVVGSTIQVLKIELRQPPFYQTTLLRRKGCFWHEQIRESLGAREEFLVLKLSVQCKDHSWTQTWHHHLLWFGRYSARKGNRAEKRLSLRGGRLIKDYCSWERERPFSVTSRDGRNQTVRKPCRFCPWSIHDKVS